MARGSLAKNWCITINKPSTAAYVAAGKQEEDDPLPWTNLTQESAEAAAEQVFLLLREICGEAYLAASGQFERAPTTGQLHWQGNLYLQTKKRLLQLKLRSATNSSSLSIHGMHVEVMRGTPAQAEDYTSKEETRLFGPWTDGDIPQAGQGKRTDCSAALEMIRSGATIKEILEARPSCLRLLPRLNEAQIIFCPPKTWRCWFLWIYGLPGTGKTTLAGQLATRLTHASASATPTYYKDNSMWWPGYARNYCIVWDNFMPRPGLWDALCRLWDPTPSTVEVKGSHAMFSARWIIFTSVSSPATTWEGCKPPTAHWSELSRRCLWTLAMHPQRSMPEHRLSEAETENYFQAIASLYADTQEAD